MKALETKKQLRQLLGFYSWFRDYIRNFSMHAKPLTDLTAKRVHSFIPWGKTHNNALNKLKELLCKATMYRLYIVDYHKPFNIHVDASVEWLVVKNTTSIYLFTISALTYLMIISPKNTKFWKCSNTHITRFPYHMRYFQRHQHRITFIYLFIVLNFGSYHR